jgi:hypothetical protein
MKDISSFVGDSFVCVETKSKGFLLKYKTKFNNGTEILDFKTYGIIGYFDEDEYVGITMQSKQFVNSKVLLIEKEFKRHGKFKEGYSVIE